MEYWNIDAVVGCDPTRAESIVRTRVGYAANSLLFETRELQNARVQPDYSTIPKGTVVFWTLRGSVHKNAKFYAPRSDNYDDDFSE
jgi:hypothetical protein